MYERANLRENSGCGSGGISREFHTYQFESDPALLRELAERMVGLILDQVDALAGLELGGVPIATVLPQRTGTPVRAGRAKVVAERSRFYGTSADRLVRSR
jgi:orotate phosphoribosyltransferase